MKKIGLKILCFILCAGLIIPGPWFAPAYAEDEGEAVTSETVVTDEITEENEEAVTDEVTEEPQVTEDEVTEEEVTEEVTREPETASEEEVSSEPEEVTYEYSGKEIRGDYFKQYLGALLADGKVRVPSDAEVSIDSDSGSMVISGKAKKLLGAEFVIDKELDFSGAPVDRFSIDGLSKKSQRVEIGFFLDGAEEPFVTTKLYRQKSDGSYTYSKDISKDIYDLKLTGKHRVSFRILSCSESDVEIALNSFEFCESSIPVIYFDIDEEDGTIDAMNSSENHSAECYGSMTIRVPDGYESVDTGKVLSGGTYNLEYIRGRGNSTWSKDKKPYKLKLGKKSDLLGMGENKHWVLLANYFDNSLLRNRVTYWIGKQLGMPFTPDSEPVDVVMNGEYYGSYFLCEQVRVGNTRVDIDDLEDNPSASEEPEVTGGYLLHMAPSEGEKRFSTSRGFSLGIDSPEFTEETSDAQFRYIKEYVQSVEDALYGDDFKDASGTSYTELMDMESTADYYMLQEFSKNFDSYISDSTYLYKERDKDGEKGKLYWGPLWDFDYVAWGSTEYHGLETEDWINTVRRGLDSWNERLFEDPEFVKALNDSWNRLMPIIDEVAREGGQLDKYEENLAKSAEYNFEKWGYSDLWGYGDTPEGLSYDFEIERFRTWINERAEWVDENIGNIAPKLTDVTFTDMDGRTLFTKQYYSGRRFKELPEAPEKPGYIFTGWEHDYEYTLEEALARIHTTVEELRAEFGMFFDDETVDKMIEMFAGDLSGTEILEPETVVEENMTVRAGYICESEITKTKEILFDKDKYYAVYEPDGYCTIRIGVQAVPFDATYQEYEWSSSDKDVAYPTGAGFVEIFGAGDAVITVKSKDGTTASVPVHVYSYDEYVEMGMPEQYMGTVQENAELKEGEYLRLNVSYDEPEGKQVTEPMFTSVDEDIVQVGECGVIKGLKAGTTEVICVDASNVTVCKVTVTGDAPEKDISVGDTVTADGISYVVISDREVKAAGALDKGIKNLVIPEKIDVDGRTFTVTKIKDRAFENLKSLETVKIAKSVEIIGKYAFSGCKSLKKVTIYAREAKVYDTTFKGTPASTLYYVRGDAYSYYKLVLKNKKVRKLILGSTYVRNGIKYKVTSSGTTRTVTVTGLKKTGLKKITVPAYVTISSKKYKVNAVGSSAFKNRTKITSVSIGSNVKTIGSKAFYGCKKLKKVTIRGSKVKIGTSAFSKIRSGAVFYVPKSSLAYYKGILKGKTVKKI